MKALPVVLTAKFQCFTFLSLQARAKPPHGYGRYDRFRQEEIGKQDDTAGFKIDTMRTFHGMPLKSVTEEPKKPMQSLNERSKPISAARPSSGSQKRGVCILTTRFVNANVNVIVFIG